MITKFLEVAAKHVDNGCAFFQKHENKGLKSEWSLATDGILVKDRDSESGWRSLNNMYKTEDMLLAMPSSMRTVLASAQRSTARTSSSILGVWHRRCQHGLLRSENQQESEPAPMLLSSDMI